jgi:hypothetical protein
MKRRLSIGLSILAVAAAIPFVSGTPVLANLQQAGSSIVKNILAPQVKLNLGAEKQVVSFDVTCFAIPYSAKMLATRLQTT